MQNRFFLFCNNPACCAVSQVEAGSEFCLYAGAECRFWSNRFVRFAKIGKTFAKVLLRLY